ncbi:metallophosphoesterase 1 isoform X1 [Polistes fuscatus]|uniref:metallophosphoesterase 1 isoform X1 n=2 Tax=Polistes fuscatus TaxID=30207 RepID=UPI001CA7C973|nr:metallophosphoesterase 1 isoform X1 [Polistes fuscatus]
MYIPRKRFYNNYLFIFTLISASVLFFCEYLIYYIVLTQCNWPSLDPRKAVSSVDSSKFNENPVRAMFISDTHLLGPKKGHWFDKLRREWQMYRAFQTAVAIHKPNIIFILGDIFDEGDWSNDKEFDNYVSRFHSLFSVPDGVRLYTMAGNHDIGFHYAITPYTNQRFINKMKAPSVRRISSNGNHFILINSMALEGDGCFLCKSTEIAIDKIAEQLQCAKGIDNNCTKSKDKLSMYSRPILLQHYPLYRVSDEMCNEPDEAPRELKSLQFRERWECLSKEASKQLLDILNPRLVVDGHTHYGCRRIHKDDILEFTIPSFSWRNINNPSFLLGVFTPNNFSVSKCYMPVESTVILIYIIIIVGIFVYLTIKYIPKIILIVFLKMKSR